MNTAIEFHQNREHEPLTFIIPEGGDWIRSLLAEALLAYHTPKDIGKTTRHIIVYMEEHFSRTQLLVGTHRDIVEDIIVVDFISRRISDMLEKRSTSFRRWLKRWDASE